MSHTEQHAHYLKVERLNFVDDCRAKLRAIEYHAALDPRGIRAAELQRLIAAHSS